MDLRDGTYRFVSQTLHVCHICLHWGGFGGQWGGIYGSPMECLGLDVFRTFPKKSRSLSVDVRPAVHDERPLLLILL